MKRNVVGIVAFVLVPCVVTTILLSTVAGCSTTEQNERVMTFLERGRAEGELQVGTQAAFSVGAVNEFFIGMKGTTVSFTGKVDFKHALSRPPGEPSSDDVPAGDGEEGQ